MSQPAPVWGPAPTSPERPPAREPILARNTDFALGDAPAPDEIYRRHGRRHLWIVRRLCLAVLTLLLVSILIFAATQALPTDPARAILGHEAAPAAVNALRQQLGLDKPVTTQYFDWLKGVLTGDLGESYATQAPVTDLVGARLLNSAELAALVLLLTVPLSLLIGIATATRRDGLGDNVFNMFSVIVYALPEFVIGILLVTVFATSVWKLVPALALIPPGDTPFQHLHTLVLPVATLTLVSFPYLARLVRASMIEALESDYVEVARLKGLSGWRLTLGHALPNALIPTLQGLALIIGYLAGGIVIVEVLFDFPGIGSLLANAITNRDLPLVQGIILILASVYVVVNLLADIGTVLLTPRLRTVDA